MGISLVSPTRTIARFCSTRRSLACKCSGILPISSRKSVPPLACSNLPTWSACASVKAPLTCPNSSLSKSVSVIAPASTHTIGRLARAERRWISLARTSLPVPFSPVMRIDASVVATFSNCLRIVVMAGLDPQCILGDWLLVMGDGEGDFLPVRFIFCWYARVRVSTSLLLFQGLTMKSKAPRFIPSTASWISP